MTRKPMFASAGACIALLISACITDEADFDETRPAVTVTARAFSCATPIAGGTASVTTNISSDCTSCSVSGAPNVIDSDPASYASISLLTLPKGSNASIAARAPPGTVFSAGQTASALVSAQLSLNLNAAFYISTYLNGTLQERGSVLEETVGTFSSGEQYLLSLPTSEPFDSVELEVATGSGNTINGQGLPLAISFIDVYALCGE